MLLYGTTNRKQKWGITPLFVLYIRIKVTPIGKRQLVCRELPIASHPPIGTYGTLSEFAFPIMAYNLLLIRD
ncbi:hypothetical protein HMPREF1991_02562 [Hoylesella loescheii DSM 19665 = JCM 12249 = ATCC 15930]|uniref:Uncharacterized protein n=1 Tax=Hoylesella loescheii DSM 19665 = JCM 12249 = ATCC 15930 TaxID=1122985 RepID=A0A069QF79_HOYLO|nr:hypothetical protein HMPREF1991_02562 [Hoylesella loescheii DSM 19665 = JCM 12249 = ATCC 15930]